MSELNREIVKTKDDIALLERSLLEKRSYLAGLEKALKLQNKNIPTAESLRTGSDARRAMEIIRAAGEPLHVDRILTAMGKDITSQSKTSLTGSLAAYVRKGTIFTRTAPNTFSLVEFEAAQAAAEEDLLS